MGDVLAVDPDQLRVLGETADRAGIDATDIAARARQALASVTMSTSSTVVVAELAEELAALGRFLHTAAGGIEFADRSWACGLDGEGWFRAMRGGWLDAERDLWATLDDDTGATAIDVGPFTLSGSFVGIPRSQWVLAAIPPGCEAYGAGRHYSGGGAVRGPDGRLYPIVVPHLREGDRHVTIDADLSADMAAAASLGGADPGWHVVGYRTGAEQVRRKATWFERALWGAAVGTGLELGPTVDDDNLERVVFRPGSRPFLATGVPVVDGVTTDRAELIPGIEPTVTLMVDGRAQPYAVSDLDLQNPAIRHAAERAGVDPLQPARAELAGNVLGLTIGALQGVAVAMRLNDTTDRAYEVIFEENVDGRVRSRVQSFALEAGVAGPMLSAWHLFVDDDGRVMQSPASYQVGPAFTAGDAIPAGNSLDPDFVTTLPMTTLEVE